MEDKKIIKKILTYSFFATYIFSFFLSLIYLGFLYILGSREHLTFIFYCGLICSLIAASSGLLFIGSLVKNYPPYRKSLIDGYQKKKGRRENKTGK